MGTGEMLLVSSHVTKERMQNVVFKQAGRDPAVDAEIAEIRQAPFISCVHGTTQCSCSGRFCCRLLRCCCISCGMPSHQQVMHSTPQRASRHAFKISREQFSMRIETSGFAFAEAARKDKILHPIMEAHVVDLLQHQPP
eukprot:5303847-Amphidinium_carterae.1